MEIHLIRHTKPNIAKNVCYGQSDVGLLDSYDLEKSEFSKKLSQNYDAVFSSPLSRCLRLANDLNIGEALTDKRLMEYNFGQWEGRAWDEIPKKELDPWMSDFVNYPAPDGESLKLMFERVKNFIDELSNKEYNKVLIVSHSVVIRCFWAYTLEIPLQNLFRIKVEFGDIWQFNIDSQANYRSFIGMK